VISSTWLRCAAHTATGASGAPHEWKTESGARVTSAIFNVAGLGRLAEAAPDKKATKLTHANARISNPIHCYIGRCRTQT